ncbi:MAG: pyridine nucleotide-disulfide oxidoreductase, partial [Thermomicrobiales bacterium]
LRLRGERETAARAVTVNWVVNCSGPERDPARIEDPLPLALVQSGVARVDDLRLGLATDGEDRVLAADGSPWPTLHAIGPIAMGGRWEVVAMPDIRVQAARLASEISAGVASAAVAG